MVKSYDELIALLVGTYGEVGMKSFWLFDDEDGQPHYDTEAIAAYLLTEGVLFLNTRQYIGRVTGKTAVLFVNCNDIFCPGSDAEEVADHELQELCRMYIEEEDGILKWVADKRGIPHVRWRDK